VSEVTPGGVHRWRKALGLSPPPPPVEIVHLIYMKGEGGGFQKSVSRINPFIPVKIKGPS